MPLTCTYCSHTLSGRYRRWDDGVLCCSSCAEKHRACEACGRPNLHETASHTLCERCHPEVERCSVCTQPLLERYMKTERLGAVCLPCYEGLETCVRCQGPFVEGVHDNGRAFCKPCYQTGERCGICGEICVGTRWSHPRVAHICKTCHDTLPHCQRCSAPTRAGRAIHPETPDAVLCTRCWLDAERCHACFAPLTTRYITFSHAPERKFCPNCYDQAKRCDFCAEPMREDAAHLYPDGRLSCEECRATAVTELRELRKLQAQARRWLQDTLALSPRSAADCPIHLVDSAGLARLQDKRFSATAGFDARERGLFVAHTRTLTRGDTVIRREENLSIYVESGLPRHEALGTMTHELIHLWQFDHFPQEVALEIVEGLACWAQYHILRDVGAERSAQRVAINPDPIYGGGYRELAAMEARVGKERTVATLLEQLSG